MVQKQSKNPKSTKEIQSLTKKENPHNSLSYADLSIYTFRQLSILTSPPRNANRY